MTAPKKLTTAEAADLYHVHPETIRRRIRSGDLPRGNAGSGNRGGARYRLDPRDLDRLFGGAA